MNKNHFVSLGLLFTALGCAMPEDAPALENQLPNLEGEQAWLVAKVERPTGSVIEFYEMSPGMLVVSEVGYGEPTFTPEELESMSTAELYAEVAPTATMPTHLADALDREAELLATGELPERTGEPPKLEPTDFAGVEFPGASTQGTTSTGSSSCSWSWFQSAFCNSIPDYQVCLANRTSSRSYNHSNTNKHLSAVCSSGGSPLFSMQSRHDLAWWWTLQSWYVPTGYWRYWSHYDRVWDYDLKTSVTVITSNDRYHYAHFGSRW